MTHIGSLDFMPTGEEIRATVESVIMRQRGRRVVPQRIGYWVSEAASRLDDWLEDADREVPRWLRRLSVGRGGNWTVSFYKNRAEVVPDEDCTNVDASATLLCSDGSRVRYTAGRASVAAGETLVLWRERVIAPSEVAGLGKRLGAQVMRGRAGALAAVEEKA